MPKNCSVMKTLIKAMNVALMTAALVLAWWLLDEKQKPGRAVLAGEGF